MATEWTPDDPENAEEEFKDPKHYYDNYAQLLKDAEVDRVIKIGTPIVYTGKIDNIEYSHKITTYGLIRISKILGRDVDDLQDQLKTKPHQRFNAKNATLLSMYLNDLEDGVERRLELQKFCLRVVSLMGVVTFDFKTLFVDCMNKDSYKELCKIADSTELTDQQKLALLTTKYEEYEKEVEADFSEDLKNELNRAGRVKISSISALNMPQLIVSGVDEKPVVTRGNLLSGYSEKDMIFHF